MNLYTYGSLRLQEIWDRVVGRKIESRDAEVGGYVALKVRGETYPGLIPRVGAFTSGLVYLDIDGDTMRTLDEFEGDFYERVAIEAVLVDGQKVECETYLVRREHRNLLLEEIWDFDDFRRNLIRGFVAKYVSDFR